MNTELEIRQINKNDKKWIGSLLKERWGSPKIIACGEVYNALSLSGFLATLQGKPVGLITYSLIKNEECEIITLDSIKKGVGVGSRLLAKVIETATKQQCKRAWLVTTNDNLTAQEFYKKRGFTVVAVHKNTVRKARKLKPQIPLIGENGIPIEDEIEMEMKLDS